MLKLAKIRKNVVGDPKYNSNVWTIKKRHFTNYTYTHKLRTLHIECYIYISAWHSHAVSSLIILLYNFLLFFFSWVWLFLRFHPFFSSFTCWSTCEHLRITYKLQKNAYYPLITPDCPDGKNLLFLVSMSLIIIINGFFTNRHK